MIQGYSVYQDTWIQGVPGYSDSGCTKIQEYRVYQVYRDTDWVYQDTVIQGVPGYSDTGCTRIQ